MRVLLASVSCLLLAHGGHSRAQGIWSPTGTLGTARALHAATVLASGEVLVTGGQSYFTSGFGGAGAGQLGSAELYDPVTGSWAPAAPMANPRFSHEAVLLADGRVLVVGGGTASSQVFMPATPVPACEIWSPSTGAWTSAGSVLLWSSQNTATLLRDGRVLLTRGANASTGIFDPAAVAWTPGPGMSVPRSLHTATRLQDGTVLVAGGITWVQGVGTVSLATGEIFDPAAATWSPTGSMNSNRYSHVAAALPDGRVLVAGGLIPVGGGGVGSPLVFAEVYDPAARTWTPVTAPGFTVLEPLACRLTGGEVLMIGSTGAGGYPSVAARFHHLTRGWTDSGLLNISRGYGTLTALASGGALLAGGWFNGVPSLAHCERLACPGTGAGAVTVLGQGCLGTSGVPALAADGLPSIGNCGFALLLSQGPPGATALLFLTGLPAMPPVPLGGGCVLQLDPVKLVQNIASGLDPTAMITLDVAGAGSFPFAIPGIPGLAGASAFVQAAVADPAAVLGFTVTNGLRLDLL